MTSDSGSCGSAAVIAPVLTSAASFYELHTGAAFVPWNYLKKKKNHVNYLKFWYLFHTVWLHWNVHASIQKTKRKSEQGRKRTSSQERNDGYRRHEQRKQTSGVSRSIAQILGAAPDPIGVNPVAHVAPHAFFGHQTFSHCNRQMQQKDMKRPKLHQKEPRTYNMLLWMWWNVRIMQMSFVLFLCCFCFLAPLLSPLSLRSLV